MRRIARIVCVTVGAAYCWVVCASAIYLAGTGHMALFRFPWTQWLGVVPWWLYSFWTTAWVLASGIIPTVVTMGLAICFWRYRRRAKAQPLYGKSQWARPKEMEKNGIKLTQEPF
jgi:heme/copper-type cytochrome/quinol oxidase subunit 2